MSDSKTVIRKKDHINLCLNEDVTFKSKSNGFENYEFEHYAITEVEFDKIDLRTKFFSKDISYPILISSMTGGSKESEKINERLAIVANKLNIPLGVGSQRQALENDKYLSTYKIMRKYCGSAPLFGNLGAAQIANSKRLKDELKFLIEIIEADAMVIHLNPLQEILQKEGEINFKGLLKKIEKIAKMLDIPIIVKEVGCGISKVVAKKLLDAGVKGIDVAGAGGTNWAAVELLRNNDSSIFRDWGLPTSYCVRTVNELKKNYNFLLISSGGISNGVEIAKSIALGADIVGVARLILKSIVKNIDTTLELINLWINELKTVMYLTGVQNIKQLKKVKLIKKSELY